MRKHCPKCDQDLPLSDFGICRDRKDGLNSYCKSCARLVTNEGRRIRKEMGLRRKQCNGLFNRKPCVKTKDRVLQAIRRGASSQAAIKQATRLHEDIMTDAIADLYAEGKLNLEALRRREYIAA